MRHSPRYVTAGFWVLIAVVYFSMFGQWVSFTMNDRAFAEYVEDVSRLAATEHRPAKDVRDLLRIRAEQLDLPITESQIEVIGQGEKIKGTVQYDAEITVPFLNQKVYELSFKHDVAAAH
jgi:hypothetical protein